MPNVDHDVIIIGGGVGGVGLASGLAAAGHSVALVKAHPRHPDEFRAEKFGTAAMAAFERLSLGAAARAATTMFSDVHVGRRGRIATRDHRPEYAMRYPDFVDALHAALPATVRTIVGRASGLSTGQTKQAVSLADGRTVQGRLVVLATGLMRSLPSQLGLGTTLLSRAHTLVYGFDVSWLQLPVDAETLAWRGERFGDGVAYLTIFPLAGRYRANLFTHWTIGSDEAQAFSDDPSGTLARVMPGLARLGPVPEPVGSLQRRAIDLVRVTAPVREGVVLLGDAFCTTCPSSGTGMHKALNDAEVLLRLVPTWLASSAIDRTAIATFYDDPVKRKVDRDSVAYSLAQRRLLTERGLPAGVRRFVAMGVQRGRTMSRALFSARRALRAGAR